MKTGLAILVSILSLQLGAQNIFQKTYGGVGSDYALWMIQTPDQGFLMAGETNSYGPLSCFNTNGYFIRTNKYGDTLWTKVFGYPNGMNASVFICPTLDSGFISIGNCNISTAPYCDIHVVKCTALGDTVWAKRYGGADDEFANKICQTSDSGYVLVGTTKSYGDTVGFSADALVIKTDASGNVIWAYAYGGYGVMYPHSGWEGPGSFITQTKDRGYYVEGSSTSFTSDCNSEVYVFRLDSMGNVIWSKTYGGFSSDYGGPAAYTTDNGFIIAGSTESYGSGSALDMALLIKTDSLGNVIWSKTLASPGNYFSLVDVKQISNGHYVACGNISDSLGNMVTIAGLEIDPNGDTLWTNTYGNGAEQASNILETAGGFAISGYVYNLSDTYGDAYLIKTDSIGRTSCFQKHLPIIPATVTITTNTVTTLQNLASPITNTLTTGISFGGNIYNACAFVGMVLQPTYELSLYPNPTNNSIVIKAERELNYLKIYNALGDLVFELHSRNFEEQLDIGALPPAVYVVEALGRRLKLIKQ